MIDISYNVYSACVENCLSLRFSVAEVKNICTFDCVAFSDVIFARPTSSKASTCIRNTSDSPYWNHLKPGLVCTCPSDVVAVGHCLNLLCVPDIKSRFIGHFVSLRVTASFLCLSEVTWARISKHFSWLELAPGMTANQPVGFLNLQG